MLGVGLKAVNAEARWQKLVCPQPPPAVESSEARPRPSFTQSIVSEGSGRGCPPYTFG